jgi:hypothetical protein
VDFRNPAYWSSLMALFIFDLAAAVYSVARELYRNRGDRVVLALFLSVPLLLLLPLPSQLSANAFMHEGLALALAEDPFAVGQCHWFSGGGCQMVSQLPWSYAYHLLLSAFVGLGATGIKLMNSLLFVVFLAFARLSLKDRSPLYLAAFFVPQALVYLSTPFLGFASMAFGSAFFYFVMGAADGRGRIEDVVFTGAYFLHLRPENFIYVLLVLPYFARRLASRPGLFGFSLVNVLAKALEYMRGAEFTVEWGLLATTRLETFSQRLLPGLAFLLNPFAFNVLLTAFAALGVVQAVRSRRWSWASLPVAALFIYLTKQGSSFFHGPPVSRLLLGLAAACFPLVVKGIRDFPLPRALALLALLSLVPVATVGDSELALTYELSMEHKDELVEISEENSMPICSHFVYEFSDAEAVFWSDGFPYPDGSYLIPFAGELYYPMPGCTLRQFGELGGLALYNFTCTNQ